MPAPKKIKKYFLIFLSLQLFLANVNLAYAQTADYTQGGTNPVSSQIEQFLCAPSATNPSAQKVGSMTTGANNNSSANDLFTCINKMYRFAIAAGSAIGVLFIVVAGYVYMSAEGNQEAVDKAKSIFVSTITSMVILFAGWVLLRALNPDLLRFQSIQPPSVRFDYMECPPGSTRDATTNVCKLPDGTTVEGILRTSGTPSAACVPVTTGPATVASLQSSCFGSNATQASSIANLESGGQAGRPSGVDKCIEDGTPVSWGLFQINISANTINGLPCPNAFDRNLNPSGYTGSNHHCKVINQTLFDQCRQAAITESLNIQAACRISSNGTHWGAWGANSKCNFPK